MTSKQVDLTKNFFALGVMFWLFERSMDRRSAGSTRSSVRGPSSPRPTAARSTPATRSARRPRSSTRPTGSPRPPSWRPATYRNVTGNEATALGFVTGARAGRPAAGVRQLPDHAGVRHPPPVLGLEEPRDQDVPGRGRDRGHRRRPRRRVRRGARAHRARPGPAWRSRRRCSGSPSMVELPLVVVNVQRGGPSTGLPTKIEQADLLQALYDRNGEVAAAGRRPGLPGRVLRLAIEAWRIALRHMTPVVYLSDAFLANGTEPWRSPTYADAARPARRQPHREGRLLPVPARRRDARPPVGRARHARPRAPHRRASRSSTSSARSATTPTTTTGCRCCGPRRSPGSPTSIAPLEVFGPPDGRPPDPRLGHPRTAPSGARWSGCRPAAGRSPTRTCATCNPFPANTGDVVRALRQGPGPRGQPGPAALDRDPRRVPRRRDRLQPGAGQAVRHRRDRSQGRAAARRPVRPAR